MRKERSGHEQRAIESALKAARLAAAEGAVGAVVMVLRIALVGGQARALRTFMNTCMGMLAVP